MSDPNDRAEQDLQEHIRRFPEQYPRSLGGTMPEHPQPSIERYPGEAREHAALNREYADRAVGDDPTDQLGVHALDDGVDTFIEPDGLPSDLLAFMRSL